MKSFIFSILFLVLTMRSECSPDSRFFISAPRVFHIGVNEKVFVQMGRSYFNNPATLYLEHETKGTVSEKKPVTFTEDGQIQTVELTINKDIYLGIPPRPDKKPYLNLVVEHPSLAERRSTRVLVSKHRGYIFIQTHQPIYNPSQTVRYRIFTLDHTLRPHEETFQLSVFNPAGNRVISSNRTAKGGIFQENILIPDVSKLGTWKITAHYVGDEEKKASKEFKVEKFVLPSFEVNIEMEQSYILLNAERFDFSISAKYSHGEKVQGAYHCQFGVVEKDPIDGQKRKPFYIGGLEMTGSVRHGDDELTEASLQMADLHVQLQRLNLTLSKLQQSGSQLYLGVFVTNIQSGEIQGDEVYLPVISHKYTLDLSRTRSYFLPGYPLDVSVVVRHPDGSPAADVPVKINVSSSMKEYWEGTTNQEGAVLPIFNIIAADQITVQVSADDSYQRKVIQRAKSPTNSYLYLSLTNRMYSVGESLTVHYNTVNSPSNGFIYYMVLSRGILVKQGKLPIGTALVHNLPVTHHMIPSFRLIGYFYDGLGNIIADSVWVDVQDECEIKVKVKYTGPFKPKQATQLEFDLNGQKAKVAMLVVDKAIYALKADNKLTAKQVFSTMQSYDLGCSYTGGSDPDSVLTDAGLSFVTHSSSVTKKEFGCGSRSTRKRRAVDLQQEMITLRSNFSDENLKKCCVHGFSLIPMTRTCQERARRVSLVSNNPLCAEAFLRCCLEGERLRQRKREEDARKELGRTATTEDIEQYFLEEAGQNIRRLFPPSFGFTEFDVDGKKSHQLILLDSITTWEIQVVTLSAATGFCVVKPMEIKAFQKIFVSLRLPYSVRKYEQLSISPVIYNYGEDTLQVAVNMEQTEGLCSPGSATTTAFVNITLKPQSSQFVSFSAVPMVTGSIPIKIHIYDIERENGLDSIEKTLKVLTEGMEKRVEETKVFNLEGRSTDSFIIDGSLPEDTVPDSGSNIFVSVEGDGFGSSHAENLLSPEKVEKLIKLPNGCLEQTMRTLYPTVVALRYLDLSDQWLDLPAGARDKALGHVETGYPKIISYKDKATGSYSSFKTVPSSYWATALIVKMLSMVAQRQSESLGQQGRQAKFVPEEEIRHPVRYLLRQQKDDGSFRDPNPVLHRDVLQQGNDQDASTTAFITVALQRSLEFLNPDEKNNAEATISRSTTYLLSQLEDLKHPYAVAITAYCLAFCLPLGTDHSSAWTKLQALATEGQKGCLLWTTNPSSKNQAHADANTIETTAYALLTAVELEKTEWANKAACWLTTQENYIGGFRSTQDTVMALEALAEYEIKGPASKEANLRAVFTSPGKRDILKLNLENKKDRVERDLKKLAGQNINVEVSGIGKTKLKVVKAYHILEPKDDCKEVSIRITVQGKVKYTATVIENYDYYDYDIIQNKDVRVPQSAIELFDAQTRNRRSLDNDLNSDQDLTYEVCVSLSMYSNLTGMAIADITLLSGFEAVTEDLDILRDRSEGYISHYEVSHGKVLVYFDRLFGKEECINFRAIQTVPIGLLQPAPAVFYDYYEPNRKCTVFYSAPLRSKLISKLCSEDVCQCAERPCHKVQITFKSESGRRKKENKRLQHACFFPTVDYAYFAEVLNVSMKSNFVLYRMNITEVLKSYGDIMVAENSIRVFAKRLQCRGELELGTQYLIMGKDGSTTDSEQMMQYLLESNTWVERKPSEEECKKSGNRVACREFTVFTEGYKVDGCRQ